MTADVEHVTRDPRWHNFLRGISQLGLFFTEVEAIGALSRDVRKKERQILIQGKQLLKAFERRWMKVTGQNL